LRYQTTSHRAIKVRWANLRLGSFYLVDRLYTNAEDRRATGSATLSGWLLLGSMKSGWYCFLAVTHQGAFATLDGHKFEVRGYAAPIFSAFNPGFTQELLRTS